MEIILFVTVASLVTGTLSQETKVQIFKTEKSLSNRKCNAQDEIEGSMLTRSKITCVSACMATADCQSVFYENGNCFRCRSTYTESQATSLPSRPGSIYMYYKKESPTESTTRSLSYKNSSYYFSSIIYRNFTDAKQYCSSINSHVLVIDDTEENEFVINSLNKFADINAIWLGVQENNGVVLSAHDNKTVSLTNWYNGEPNNANEPCVASYRHENWRWGDRICFLQKLFVVCEYN